MQENSLYWGEVPVAGKSEEARMDVEEIEAALTEANTLLQGDGAALALVDADAKAARLRLQLDLSRVECADCIIPPDLLADVVRATFQRRIPEEFELLIDDPRRVVRR